MKLNNVLILNCLLTFFFLGTVTAAAGCVEGDCSNGHGTYRYGSGNEYTGTFKNGRRDGQGVFIFTNGEKYIGEFKEGKRSGTGVYFFKEGMKYEGEYENDERNGYGIFTLPNGARYEGEYKDGIKHGQGKFIFPDGNAVNGTWKNGAFEEPNTSAADPDNRIKESYSLVINTVPADAKIRFLDRELQYVPHMKLVPGRYRIEISRDRYVTKVEYIDILDADLTVPLNLKLASLTDLEMGTRDGAGIEKVAVADGGESATVRGVDLDRGEVKFNSLFVKEQEGMADELLREMDRRRISAALEETGKASKLSMVEQVQQEIEMLKTSFGEPQLLSMKPLPGTNDDSDRVALVIGNSSYPLIGELKNPENDAKDVAAALRKLDFNVTVKLNADQEEMETAIIEFGKHLKKESVSLFYFAGHGVQIDGNNYLIPVQSGIKQSKDIRYKAVDLNMLIDVMVAAKNGKNIIILDACRNNPLPKGDSRYETAGLARTDAPAGTLIAYATSPGSVAIDGEGRNGIYTSYLLENIDKPGVPIEMVFKRVLQGVAADTNRKQIPWMSSSLDIDFYFALN